MMESWSGYAAAAGYGFMPSSAAMCLPYPYGSPDSTSHTHQHHSSMINLAATYFPTPHHPQPSMQPGIHHHLPGTSATNPYQSNASLFHFPCYDAYSAVQQPVRSSEDGVAGAMNYSNPSPSSFFSSRNITAATTTSASSPFTSVKPSSSGNKQDKHINQHNLSSDINPNYYGAHRNLPYNASSYSVESLASSSSTPAAVNHVIPVALAPASALGSLDPLYSLSPSSCDGTSKYDASATPLTCNVCNKSCDSYHSLKRHRREHLQRSGSDNVGKLPQCPDSVYQFVDEGEIEPQRRGRKSKKKSKQNSGSLESASEDGEMPKPFFCELCGDRFTIKSSLVTHMRRHTGERPYQCSYCSKTFTQKGNLQTHIRTHTGEKPYRCNKCEKCYTSGAALNYHRNHHH